MRCPCELIPVCPCLEFCSTSTINHRCISPLAMRPASGSYLHVYVYVFCLRLPTTCLCSHLFPLARPPALSPSLVHSFLPLSFTVPHIMRFGATVPHIIRFSATVPHIIRFSAYLIAETWMHPEGLRLWVDNTLVRLRPSPPPPPCPPASLWEVAVALIDAVLCNKALTTESCSSRL
jgi:hypothetical protein